MANCAQRNNSEQRLIVGTKPGSVSQTQTRSLCPKVMCLCLCLVLHHSSVPMRCSTGSRPNQCECPCNILTGVLSRCWPIPFVTFRHEEPIFEPVALCVRELEELFRGMFARLQSGKRRKDRTKWGCLSDVWRWFCAVERNRHASNLTRAHTDLDGRYDQEPPGLCRPIAVCRDRLPTGRQNRSNPGGSQNHRKARREPGHSISIVLAV